MLQRTKHTYSEKLNQPRPFNPIGLIAYGVITLLIGFSLSYTALAYDKEFNVQIRLDKKLDQDKRTLPDLESESSFDGKYFKIVKGRSEDAIEFAKDGKLIEDHDSLIFRAATMYYHMSLARAYFKNLAPELATLDQKHTIRIEVDLAQNDAIKMDMDKIARQDPKFPDDPTKTIIIDNPNRIYNSASTYPASNSLRSKSISPWGVESWFNKAKKIVIKNMSAAQVAEILNSSQTKTSLTQSLLQNDVTSVVEEGLNYGFSNLNYKGDLISIGLSLGVPEVMPLIIKGITKFFKTTFYADTGVIPEIIYHEYTHIAFSDTLSTKKESALTEGLANYFAAKISGLESVGGRPQKLIRGFGTIFMKTKMMYSNSIDLNAETFHSSFAPAVLMDFEHTIGHEDQHWGEKTIARAAEKYWTPNTPFHKHLINTQNPVSLTDGMQKAIQSLFEDGLITENPDAVFTKVQGIASDKYGI